VAPERVGRVVALLAVAAGITVANLYYAQPLLDALAGDFGVGRDAVSLVVTLGQLGYAAGIVALVPLGDVVDDRKLTLRVLAVAVAAAAACALAPSFVVFLTAALVLGSTAVVAQIVLPIAARVVPAERRGQLVGRVTGGLLLGILLARAFAGLVAAASSWRVVFGFSAVAMAVLAVVLARSLPRRGPTGALHYRSLLGSVAVLVREEPVLRRRALYQAAMFGAFSLFSTSASFQLAGLGVGQAGIGVFALVGAAGALAAPLAGRLGDRGLGRPATGVTLLLAAAAAGIAGFGARSVLVLAVAAVVLDLAVQANLVLGQQAVYARRPEARSRMNAVYIGSFFLAGAAGSAVSGFAYTHGGWRAVMAVAAALPLPALLRWVGEVRSLRGRGRRRPTAAIGGVSDAHPGAVSARRGSGRTGPGR